MDRRPESVRQAKVRFVGADLVLFFDGVRINEVENFKFRYMQ